MAKLKVAPEAEAAIADVRDPSTDACDWLLLSYGDTKNTLSVYKSGHGGMDALKAELIDAEILYGIVMVKGGNEKDKLAVRFAGVSWCGHSVSAMKRSRILQHKEGVAKALGHCHITFQPKEVDELSQENMMKTIQLTAGTNYHAGLRNMEKDADGNYKTADGEHVTAKGAKAAYDANAQASQKTTTKVGGVVDAKPAADDGKPSVAELEAKAAKEKAEAEAAEKAAIAAAEAAEKERLEAEAAKERHEKEAAEAAAAEAAAAKEKAEAEAAAAAAAEAAAKAAAEEEEEAKKKAEAEAAELAAVAEKEAAEAAAAAEAAEKEAAEAAEAAAAADKEQKEADEAEKEAHALIDTAEVEAAEADEAKAAHEAAVQEEDTVVEEKKPDASLWDSD